MRVRGIFDGGDDAIIKVSLLLAAEAHCPLLLMQVFLFFNGAKEGLVGFLRLSLFVLNLNQTNFWN